MDRKRGSKENRAGRTLFLCFLAILFVGPWILFVPLELSGQIVQGHLVDARTGSAMNGADVALRDSTHTVVARTATNYQGAFRITPPGPGTYSLRAEALGYRSTDSRSFEVKEGEVITIDLSLSPRPVELDTLDVEAEPKRIIPFLEQQGFYERLEDGFGHFITPEEIEAKNPRYLYDLVRDIPGVRATWDGELLLGPRCRGLPERVFVDGIQIDDSTIPVGQRLLIDEILAAEFYLGPASVPLQYGGTGGHCVVVFWTKG